MISWKILLVPGLFALLLGLEHLSPLRKRKRPWPPRLAVNLVMTVCVFCIGALVARAVGLITAAWSTRQGYGLCSLVPLPPWAGVLLGASLMDLTFYYWHRANHKIPLLWRFHNVHHVDPDLDVSTSFRFHFVEIAYSALFRIAQVLVLGIDPLTYLIYGTVFSCATMFHHSNLRLPYHFERLLNKVLVTPRMHGVHHSDVITETDSNYSVIFSWWDRFHRTLVVNVPQSAINVGVPAYQDTGDNRLWPLIKTPFVKQRDYWHLAEEALPRSNQIGDHKPSHMLP